MLMEKEALIVKKKCFYALLLTLALILTACGGGSNAGMDSAASDSMVSMSNQAAPSSGLEAPTLEPNRGWEEDYYDLTSESKGESDGVSGSDGTSGHQPLANAKLIYRANLDLESKSFEEASTGLDQLVEQAGGYYESRSISQGGSRRHMYATVRVPSEAFDSFLTNAGEVAHMTECSRYVENISEAYYDTESRLATQRTKMERLQTLLSQAENMADIITIESAIADTELEIEHLTGDLRQYDSLIGFSTIEISLWEVYRLSTDMEVPATFGQRLGAALSDGLTRGMGTLEEFIIFLAANWLLFIFLAAVVALVITLARFRRKRRHIPATPQPSAPVPPDHMEPSDHKDKK